MTAQKYGCVPAALAGAGVFLCAIVISTIIGLYVTEPQPMLRSITIWMHHHSFHLLPSTMWLAIVGWLAGVAAICAFFAGLWHRPHAVALPSFGDAMREEMLHNLALHTALTVALQRRAPMGGASPSQPLPFAKGSSSMFNVQEFILKAEIAALNVALNAATNDKDKFVAVMQAFVAKGGTELEALALPFVKNQFASNPLLSEVLAAFEPEVESAIDGEVTKLEGEAGTEEEKLLALGVGALQAEIANREAALQQLESPTSDTTPPSAATATVTPAALSPEQVELNRS